MPYQCLQHTSLTLGTASDAWIELTIGQQYTHPHAFPQKKHVCGVCIQCRHMYYMYTCVCVYSYMHIHILVSKTLNSSQKGKQPIKAV